MKRKSTGQKTRSERKLEKAMRSVKRTHDKAIFASYIATAVGTEIVHKDRTYVIQRDGSYRRITEKDDIIRSSINYK